ncbi:GntR family transcriptional regulator [Paenarthrobacter aurescens]|nr:GntR family transcriptional regulator [Paenarthrobacter aurescens]UKA51027.1 GntR family transcriptional regulator [Arthrobacter sp. FW305-123]MDO6142765.1 GntR family transcriptional regulator [Paenarthrobacter aurescens]MDO6146611.1 GntR family transcriptional regulator [Paenarthrobacter aurescens]MDO6157857.1 GntR family transcriptional regulator [Paenarthrobacter aurescens]MDO6161841.1 GntR family transcriptional regulator [Paenarthrobacter aurescens]
MSTQQNAPLHVRLSEEFMRRITDGDWPPGFQLPSEAELCREFGTSRGPIRQALAFLRSEGAVTGGRGRPPMVRSSVPSQSFSTFNSFTEWASGIGKKPGQRTLEVARREASPEAAEALGLMPGTTVVEVLRVRYLDEAPAMIERTTFILDVGRKLFDFDTDSGSIFAFLKEQGVDLHSARHTIDAVAASDEDAELLEQPEGIPLLRERRITRSADGQPLEYSEDRYLPALTNFTIDNTVDRRAALVRIHTDPQSTQGATP